MTTITIRDPNQFPERNTALFLFSKLLQDENQFQIQDTDILVAFNKGEYFFSWDEESREKPTSIMDCGSLVDRGSADKQDIYILLLLIASLKEKTLDHRELPATVITEFLKIKTDFHLEPTLIFEIHQPGRNGFLRDGVIHVSRKDW